MPPLRMRSPRPLPPSSRQHLGSIAEGAGRSSWRWMRAAPACVHVPDAGAGGRRLGLRPPAHPALPMAHARLWPQPHTPPSSPGAPREAHRDSAIVIGSAVEPAGSDEGAPRQGRLAIDTRQAPAPSSGAHRCEMRPAPLPWLLPWELAGGPLGLHCLATHPPPPPMHRLADFPPSLSRTRPSNVRSCGRAFVITRLGGVAPLEHVRQLFQAPPAARTTASFVLLDTPAGACRRQRHVGGMQASAGACRGAPAAVREVRPCTADAPPNAGVLRMLCMMRCA